MKTLVLTGMVVLALTPAAAAQPGPDIDRPFVAGDWITACDSTRKCGAFSLPEAGPLETPADLFVRITRDYPPGSEPLLTLELKDEHGALPHTAEVRVLIDGQESLDRHRLDGGALSLRGTDATDPYWEHTDGVLVVERKDRAYGDCGERQEYVWDTAEKRFRLFSYASMPACRGIREVIITYAAEIAIPPSESRLVALDCGSEITGLDWGVCWDVELRELALRIEAKQRDLRSNLGPEAGDALIADWGMLLDDLRRSLGHRWLDSAAGDVEETFKWRLQFLSRISPRDGLEGHWGNHAARIEVHSNRGETIFDVTSEGCGVTMAAGEPPMLETVGGMLRLTVRRPDFERAYPSLVGCFNPGRSESVVDGIYFPLSAPGE